MSDIDPGTDSGLLAPTWAGSRSAALVNDEAWVRAMIDVEVALARAQSRLGVVPSSAAHHIATAARACEVDVAALAATARNAANPVVSLVSELTTAVARVDKTAAEYVHRGCTSQDILDSAMMLVTRSVFDETEACLLRAATSLAELAERFRLSPMAARTLTQHAVPTTFGLKAAGWLVSVVDAVTRLRHVRSDLRAQLGGAAGTLASYLEYAGGGEHQEHARRLTAEFAAELGLSEATVPWHTLRGPISDIGAVSVYISGVLGKIALDVLGMSRTEVAEVAEAPAEGRGVSSTMPQKQNPVLSVLVMAAARQVPLYATILNQAMLAEDERSAGGWHAEWQPLRECLRLVGAAAHTAAELLTGLRVFPDRLAGNLEMSHGTIVAERLSVVLTPRVGKVEAKKVLERIALRRNGSFSQALRQAHECAHLDDETLAGLLDPTAYLGAAPLLVDRALDRYRSMRDR